MNGDAFFAPLRSRVVDVVGRRLLPLQGRAGSQEYACDWNTSRVLHSAFVFCGPRVGAALVAGQRCM